MPELQTLFRLDVPALELVLRGTAMYWFLFALFRFVIRRDAGAIGIADVLLLVLIADAAQNAMSGSYQSITGGCVLVATIVGWNWLLDWASFHFAAVRRFAEPPPLPLVRNGRMIRNNMRRQLVTPDELQAKLREHGLERLSQVKSARMESDGEITVIPADDAARMDGKSTGREKTVA